MSHPSYSTTDALYVIENYTSNDYLKKIIQTLTLYPYVNRMKVLILFS